MREELEKAAEALVAALQHVGDVRHQGGIALRVDVDKEVGRLQQFQAGGAALGFGDEIAVGLKARMRQYVEQGVEGIEGFLVAALVKQRAPAQESPGGLRRLIGEPGFHPGEGGAGLPAVQQRLTLVLEARFALPALPHAPGGSRQQTEAKDDSHEAPKGQWPV